MVERAIVLTLGFDERFALRALMRAAPLKDDKVIVFLPNIKDERAERALNLLKDFYHKIGGTALETHELPIAEPMLSIAQIYRVLVQELRQRKLYFSLSGGMRALILEVLAAAIAAAKYVPNTEIEVELENLSGMVKFTLTHFMLSPPGSLDLSILTAIKELQSIGIQSTLSTIYSKRDIPRSTLHRRLKDLMERGYVKSEKLGKSIIYSLTELGMIWA